MEKKINVLGMLEALNDFRQTKEDGTYDFQTHENVEYASGYQVSFVRPEIFDQLSAEQWDTLTSYYCDYLQSAAHIGVYAGDAEISFHSMESTKAEEVMEKFNQESLLDWAGRANYPQDATRWFVMNRNFDENKLVNYNEILESIQ